MQLAPWLQPFNPLASIEGGANAGLALQRLMDARDTDLSRLALERDDAEARHKLAQDQFAAEQKNAAARLALAGQQQNQNAALDLLKTSLLDQYHQAEVASQAQARQTAADALLERQRHGLAMESISESQARAKINRGEGKIVTDPMAPGMLFLEQPNGFKQVIQKDTAPRVTLDPTGKIKSTSGLLDDPRIIAAMGTNAPNATVSSPSPPSDGSIPNLFPGITAPTPSLFSGGVADVLQSPTETATTAAPAPAVSLLDRATGRISNLPIAPTAPAKSKVQRANELSQQHPDWTKQQVIDAVNSEMQ